MKKMAWAIGCILLLGYSSAFAQSSPYGVSLGYGQSNDNIDIYRIGLQRDFGHRWFESAIGYFSGYFELSYGHWDASDDEINCFALSPVFAYYFDTGSSGITPYIEAGIGVAYLDEYRIKNRNLSSNFQFEDRIGLGARFHRLDLNFRYMHYSNAGLEGPNDGIDIWMGSVSWRF